MIANSLLVAVLIFQLFTCYMLLLSDSWLYFAFATSMVVLSIVVFVFLYSKRLEIEKELKLNFGVEKIEEEGLIFELDIYAYYHPLQDKAEIKNI